MTDDVSGVLPGALSHRPATAAERRRHVARRLAVVATVWAAGLALAALLIPAYNGETVSALNGVTLTRLTLVQSHSPWIVALVMFPLPAALVTLASGLAPAERSVAVEVGGSRFDVSQARRSVVALRRVATAATILVGLEGVLAIASVGAFLLPVAILSGLALGLGVRR
jgi:hypothetical protein